MPRTPSELWTIFEDQRRNANFPQLRAQALAATQRAFTEGATRAGDLLERVRQNPVLNFSTRFLPAGWLAGAVNGVDVRKSQKLVDRLRTWYPDDTPRQIAQRMMVQKAVQVGSIGFVSHLIPGFLAPLFLVDLASTAVLMAELVFQIAAAYGADLEEPQRKGEVLAIFGMTFGGQSAIRAGITALKAVPLAGAAIGGGANAAMLFSLGHAACSFYETGGHQLDSEAAVTAAIAANADYAAHAVAQQSLMEQFLVILRYAGGETRPIPEVVAQLVANTACGPAAAGTMATWGDALPEHAPLMAALDREFAIALLSEARLLAWEDQRITPAEARLLEELARHFTITAAELAWPEVEVGPPEGPPEPL